MGVSYDLIKASEKRYDKNFGKIEKTRGLIENDAPLEEMNSRGLIARRVNRLGPSPEIGRERLIGKMNNLLSINYLMRGLQVARTVCRLVYLDRIGNSRAMGTGFLISPDLLMTNNHVIPDPETAGSMRAEFNFQITFEGQLQPSVKFQLQPGRFFITSPDDQLDYTVVAVSPQSETGTPLSVFGWNALIELTGKVVNGESLTIIQHPNGEPKQIALRENKLLERDDRFLFYETDTNPGSSGAPVFNNQWEIVALHHSGVPKRDDRDRVLTRDGRVWHPSMGEHVVDWIANEGVRISRIIKDIQAQTIADDSWIRLRENLMEGRPSYVPLEFSMGAPVPVLPPVVGPPRPEPEPEPVRPTVPDRPAVQPGEAKTYRYELLTSPSLPLRTAALAEVESRFGVATAAMFKDNDVDNQTLARYYEVEITTAENPWKIAADLEAIDGIQEVDPDLPAATWTAPVEETDSAAFESSRRRGSNKELIEEKFPDIHPRWNHELTKFPEAIEYSRKAGRLNGMTGIKVAQLDTGYSGHEEIANLNPGGGYDFIDLDFDPSDSFGGGLFPQPGHGTRTAAVFAGRATGLEGDLNDGVFPMVDFVPFRVSNSVVILGTANNVSQAVHQAIKNNYDIITMSMGSYGRRSWRDLARLAYENGVFWICAAGNEVHFVVRPAAYPGTIAAAAVNYKGIPWEGSSMGRTVDVSAPGENVYVPRANFAEDRSYGYGSGTSYAAPHIAAAAALWLNHHADEIADRYEAPWQRVEAFRYCLAQSVDVPENWNNEYYGSGILNALKLLKAKLPKPDQLQHRYQDTALEAVREATPTLSEKELLYHHWNKGLERAGAPLESLAVPRFTESAQKLFRHISTDPSLFRESTGDRSFSAYLDRILQGVSY